ncbi:hypothetical protein JL722_10193 [Aureococcus anophagefferens]|nr:hypothetical protein JL722_10193 [Aureococcus anophagefferens]
MDAKRAADARHCDRILAAPSFYDVLEVSRSADEAHVRKCYLKVSLRVHPDRNADPRAKAAFQRVAEAYETLAGPGRRAYDAARRRASGGRAAPPRPPGPGPRRDGGLRHGRRDADLRGGRGGAEAAAAESAGVPASTRAEAAARVEETANIDRWGLVEGAHDYDLARIQVQLASASFFADAARAR